MPHTPYEYAEWKRVKPGIDYHIAVDKRFYSVPNNLIGTTLDVRLTATTIEVLHKGQRVASHPRHGQGRYSTLTELGYAGNTIETDTVSYDVTINPPPDASNFTAIASYKLGGTEAGKCLTFTIDGRGTQNSNPKPDCWTTAR
mgnify:CR=1 FL=1